MSSCSEPYCTNKNAPEKLAGSVRGVNIDSQSNLKPNYSTRAAQCSIILKALRKSSLTTFQIRTEFDIPHAGGRICDLRNAGHEIDTELVWDSMPGGGRHKVARYTLMLERQKELQL